MMMILMMVELLLMYTALVAHHHKKSGHLMRGVELEKRKVCTAYNNFLQHLPSLI